MPVNFKAFERAMKKAVEAKKQAAALSTTPVAAKAPPVAAKAPVAALKVEEKPALTQTELDYWVNLLMQHQKPKLSTTDRLIRERLDAMGLAPNDD